MLSELPQIVASGLTTGAMFALVGVGFALIFNSSDVINFAQGEFVMVGGFAYVGLLLLTHQVVVSAVLAVVLAAALGGLIYVGLIRRLRRSSVLNIVMLTLGLATLFRGAALVSVGPNPFAGTPLSGSTPVRVLGAALAPQFFWIIGALVAIGIVLWWFFNRSATGMKMIACAVDRRAAALCGIDVSRMVLLSWVLSALLAGLAGVLLTPLINVTYDQGFAVSLNGFAAAALGGVGRVDGAIFGGLAIGLANALAAGYLPQAAAGYHDIVGLLILVAVLVAKPSGLFGGRAEARHAAVNE